MFTIANTIECGTLVFDRDLRLGMVRKVEIAPSGMCRLSTTDVNGNGGQRIYDADECTWVNDDPELDDAFGIAASWDVASVLVEIARAATPTCGPYCAKTHCACGRDALHGRKVCGVCAR